MLVAEAYSSSRYIQGHLPYWMKNWSIMIKNTLAARHPERTSSCHVS